MHHPPSRPHRATKRSMPPHPAVMAEYDQDKIRPEPAALDCAIEASPRLSLWMQAHKVSLALSTGVSGKILTIGTGAAGLTVFDVGCDGPGALLQTAAGLYVAARARVWCFDDALSDGELFRGAYRLCLPNQCRGTGPVGIQDIAATENGRLMVASARFNCIARMNTRGDLKPIWRPSFIDAAAREDRCHLTGFCLRDGALAYVAVTAATNEKDGWRQALDRGGQVIDATTQKPVAKGLTLPHAPRLYRDRLWVLESGAGFLGWIDPKAQRFERFAELPGFPRGLRFIGDHALVTTSRLRNAPDDGFTGVHWINLKTGRVDHVLRLDGAIDEVIDVAAIPGETVPRLAGLSVADSGQPIENRPTI